MINSRLRTVVTLAMTLLVLPAISVCGQEKQERRASGDSTFKDVIAPITRAIYDQDGDWVNLLTRESVLLDEGSGTEIRARGINGTFNHIVATQWGSEGKYSVEYYLDAGSPIFVYETFEYYKEAARQDSWRNFKGVAAWERRSYCDSTTIGYSEVTGLVEPAQDIQEFVLGAKRLLAHLGESR